MTSTVRCGVPLAELAALGPYFGVAAHDPQSPLIAPWQPLSTLTGSSLVLRDRITLVRAALASAAGRQPEAVGFRVAASVAQLGVAARLISPALGGAACSGRVLRMDQATARWQPVLAGAFPLSLPTADHTFLPCDGPGEDDVLASELARRVINGPVRSVTEMTATMSVPQAVLWGNVASAINGATSMIVTARPDLDARARAISSALLRQPPLADTYDGAPASGFRRRSCCLIYRITSAARAKFCADCILLRPSRSFR